jgi:hypothetical protein
MSFGKRARADARNIMELDESQSMTAVLSLSKHAESPLPTAHSPLSTRTINPHSVTLPG